MFVFSGAHDAIDRLKALGFKLASRRHAARQGRSFGYLVPHQDSAIISAAEHQNIMHLQRSKWRSQRETSSVEIVFKPRVTSGRSSLMTAGSFA